MALKYLTPEQIRSMSLRQKDEWWLKNVFRGDMPQLTLRAGATGMILGSVLSLTNLYIAMRTGWQLGVGITSVILAFGFYKALSKIGFGREMTVLENNAMQSIATSAGYMTAPLISSLAAYTMITGQIVPMHVAIAWMIGLATLGILFAFPMKKRFINDEQLPFPEGMAAGVVMDSLHSSDAKEGLFKAKILLGGGFVSALIELIRNEKVMRFVGAVRAIPAYYDEIIYKLGYSPAILGTPLSNLTIRVDTSVVLAGTGALVGLRAAGSMMLGAVLNYVIVAPILITKGVIVPGASGQVGFGEIVVWSVWGGVACMTTASLYSFLSEPKMLAASLKGLFSKKAAGERDPLEAIELPTRLSVIGVPIVAVALAVMSKVWFDVPLWLGIVSVPLVFIFALIAVGTTGLTSITPSAALAQLAQLSFSALAPGKIVPNILAAGVASEVSGHASNLLMDIKPGYMLGAKPRQQAVGYFLGTIAGLAVAVPVWYYFIIAGDVRRYGTEQIPVPSAVVWKAVSEVLMNGLSFLHPTARAALVIGAILGIVAGVAKQVTKDRSPFSPLGFGLAFVLPFSGVLTIFLGALVFELIERRAGGPPEGVPSSRAPVHRPPPSQRGGKRSLVELANENRETICAGVIAGGSLTGIALTIAELKIPDAAQAQSIAEGIRAAMTALGAGP